MNKLEEIKSKEIEDNKNSGDEFENFELICKKCGSKDVHISIEGGVYYGEYTGWEDGDLCIKCKSCGIVEQRDL